jgi:hypothetical protein
VPAKLPEVIALSRVEPPVSNGFTRARDIALAITAALTTVTVLCALFN